MPPGLDRSAIATTVEYRAASTEPAEGSFDPEEFVASGSGSGCFVADPCGVAAIEAVVGRATAIGLAGLATDRLAGLGTTAVAGFAAFAIVG